MVSFFIFFGSMDLRLREDDGIAKLVYARKAILVTFPLFTFTFVF
jgi:hypothetical protein